MPPSQNTSTPSTPQNFRATYVSTNTIQVSWDSSWNANNYTLDLAYDSSFNNILNNVTTANLNYTFTNLTPSTTYFIRLKANNNYGSSGYTSISVTTLPIGYTPPTYTTFLKGIRTPLEPSYLLPVKIFNLGNKIQIFTRANYYEWVDRIGIFNLDTDGNLIEPTTIIGVTGTSEDAAYFTDVLLENSEYIGTGIFYDAVVTTTICNESNSCSYSLSNIFLGKLNSQLNLIWVKSLGIGIEGNYIPIYCEYEPGGLRYLCGYDPNSADILYYEGINKIIKDPNSILLIGSLEVTIAKPLKDPREYLSYRYLLIVKLDLNGNLVWAKTISFPGYERSNAYFLTFNDGIKIDSYYYLVGEFVDTQSTQWPDPFHARDGLVAKIDENGNVIWIKMFKLTDGVDTFNRVIKMLDNNLVITGVCATSAGYRPCLIKIDQNGNLIKSIAIIPIFPAFPGSAGGHDLIITNDMNYAMIGGGASGPVVFAKFDSNLNLLNTTIFRVGEDEWTNRIIEINGGYIAVGEFNNAAPFECVIGPSGTAGLYFAKLNNLGYLEGCGCTATTSNPVDITNNVQIYTKTFNVNNYDITNYVYNFDLSIFEKKTGVETNITQYCPYTGGGYGFIYRPNIISTNIISTRHNKYMNLKIPQNIYSNIFLLISRLFNTKF